MESFNAPCSIVKRGGKIPDTTLKTLKNKIYAMKALPMLILVWLYAVSVMGFIHLILKQLNIDFSSAILSIILSLVGISLGILFYYLSLLKSKTKTYISIITGFFIVILIPSSYLVAGLIALKYLGIIGFFFIMSTVPLISVYAILKNQKLVFYASALGLMIFYFIIILFAKAKSDTLVPLYSENQIELLLLFFISFICFVELGSTSIYFNSVVSKMSPNDDINETMLSRFNQVYNRYVLQISIFLISCYAVSIVLLWNTNLINFEELMGINLSSAYGVILLVAFTVSGSFIFWYLIPREKTKRNTFSDPNFTNINEK